MPSGDAELKMIFLFKFKSHFFLKKGFLKIECLVQ